MDERDVQENTIGEKEPEMKKVEMKRRMRRPNLSMVATVTMFPITITAATMTELRQGSTLLPLL